MKNRADKILLTVFLLSLPAYAAMAYTYLTYEFVQFAPSHFEIWFARRFLLWMSLGFHAVPAFCLQLLLCRRTRRWVTVLPTAAIAGAAFWFVCGFFTATGHGTLGWALLMILSIAPAAGCVLAWVAWLILRRRGILE
ncbi:hypothetical protein N510_001564 [Firmicutes bacterium ASF500]|nr:hypothetical protein N510_001564 [Firmicutes bacterium ASF500]